MDINALKVALPMWRKLLPCTQAFARATMKNTANATDKLVTTPTDDKGNNKKGVRTVAAIRSYVGIFLDKKV